MRNLIHDIHFKKLLGQYDSERMSKFTLKRDMSLTYKIDEIKSLIKLNLKITWHLKKRTKKKNLKMTFDRGFSMINNHT